MSPARVALLTLLAALPACIQHVQVTPTPAPGVSGLRVADPPIARRAVLLLTYGFTATRPVSENIVGLEGARVETAMGIVADSLLRDWAMRSFTRVEVRRLGEPAALRAFVGDTASDAILLLPRFEGEQGSPALSRNAAVASVRLDVRVPRTGAVHSWLGTSSVGGGWLIDRAGKRSGRALAEALATVTDSLVRYRNEF